MALTVQQSRDLRLKLLKAVESMRSGSEGDLAAIADELDDCGLELVANSRAWLQRHVNRVGAVAQQVLDSSNVNVPFDPHEAAHTLHGTASALRRRARE